MRCLVVKINHWANRLAYENTSAVCFFKQANGNYSGGAAFAHVCLFWPQGSSLKKAGAGFYPPLLLEVVSDNFIGYKPLSALNPDKKGKVFMLLTFSAMFSADTSPSNPAKTEARPENKAN